MEETSLMTRQDDGVMSADFEVKDLVVQDYTDKDIDAVVKSMEKNKEYINRLAAASVGCTEPRHWVNQSGTPMLWGDGVQYVANLAGIDLIPAKNGAIRREFIGDGDDRHVVVTYQALAVFKPLKRTLPVIGSCSSKHGLYTHGGRDEAEISNLDKHAMANAEQRAVTKLLGLRGLTWDDLKRWSNGRVTMDNVKSIERRGDQDRSKMNEVQDDGTTPQQMKTKIGEMIMEYVGGDKDAAANMLESLTRFTDKKTNKVVAGKRSVNDLRSPEQIKVVYGKIKKEYDDFCAQRDAAMVDNPDGSQA